MLGGIYSQEKCPLCGQRLVDNHRDAVACPRHRRETAKNVFVKFGRKVNKWFTDYDLAARFLTGLRFKTDEGTYDERDYQASHPLSFANLTEKYFPVKQSTVKPGTFTHIKRDLGQAASYYQHMNVKEIQYAEIEDFLLSLTTVSSKTRHNVKANLHAFFVWLVRRRVIRKDQMPEFPELAFDLGFRKTVDKATQDRILEKVKEISAHIPRVHIAIKWLCTYVSIRPSELRGILEEDVDLERGLVIIRDHKTVRKTKAPKIVPLLEEDINELRRLPKGFPKVPLFRRDAGGGGRAPSSPFGKHLLYDVWCRACDLCQVRDVDLYGGTRHSSLQDLRRSLSTEDVKRLSLHSTNRALNRYIEIDVTELRSGYSLARGKKKAGTVVGLPTTNLPPKSGLST